MPDLEKTLKQNFKLDSFREWQREIIEDIIWLNDTLVFMPTWWWKSLVFQLPGLVLPWLTIVISPLISLMKDQVDKLNEIWIRAELINSTISFNEQQYLLNELSATDYWLEEDNYKVIKFLYIAPERLNSDVFVRVINKINIALIAIDEAHCISQWWHDFRPSYMKIHKFLDILKKNNSNTKIPIVALTATATKKVREDIVSKIWLNDYKIHIKWFDRKNIAIIVREISKKEEKLNKVIEIINNVNWVWIIYCSSIKIVKEVYEYLLQNDISVWMYTWEMNTKDRTNVQNNFMDDWYRVIVATNAFWMWIDKKDIRFVIHYNLPWSIENYYQEVWRAWRDWKKSFWIVIASFGDTKIQEFFIENTYPSKEEILFFYDYLYEEFEIWFWAWEEILKTYVTMAKESWLKSDMKVWSIIKILEKYEILKRWAEKNEETNFRWRWITLILWKKTYKDIPINWSHQETLKDEWYYKLEQIKKFLFVPGCRKRFILHYFWDEEDLKDLWENCGFCDYCIDKKKILSWDNIYLLHISVFIIVLDIVSKFDKKFWIKLITSFLRWSKEKRILDWWLDKNLDYWILDEYSQELVESAIEALIKNDFIEKTLGQYPVIWLTSKWRLSLTRDYLIKEEEPDLQSFVSLRSKNKVYKTKPKSSKEKKDEQLKSKSKSKEKITTYDETFMLFEEFKNLWLDENTIWNIAKKRELSQSTIWTHIVVLYEKSKIKLFDILKITSLEKLKIIKDVVIKEFSWGIDWLSQIKEKLAEFWYNEINYFEIRLCLSMLEKKDI